MDRKKENYEEQNSTHEQNFSTNEEFSQDVVYEELELSDQAVISGIVHHLAHPGETEVNCEEESH
ncbi:hypothetical protein [Fictibacillus terranigra]|uniref:DUF4025 domain-containing protein n=1 Tax=Fictibacillus terranigra TaxID=3058424 RepID=A0ABT8E149_9BACL|nr:hypothetical protein [Fictibacillus sp. CENA-BCM004]MDN4071645.1 hypothetical protein [Fictibacillus sp. CENA-BCM004]